MNITITISTNNAAFEDDPGAEVARILEMLAWGARGGTLGRKRISPMDKPLVIRDSNGITVGTVEIKV